MWALIDEMLTSLKKEKAVVDDVLSIPKDCVGQYTLDGSNVAFRVPRLLVHRVESDIHQVSNSFSFLLNCMGFFPSARGVITYVFFKKKNFRDNKR